MKKLLKREKNTEKHSKEAIGGKLIKTIAMAATLLTLSSSVVLSGCDLEGLLNYLESSSASSSVSASEIEESQSYSEQSEQSYYDDSEESSVIDDENSVEEESDDSQDFSEDSQPQEESSAEEESGSDEEQQTPALNITSADQITEEQHKIISDKLDTVIHDAMYARGSFFNESAYKGSEILAIDFVDGEKQLTLTFATTIGSTTYYACEVFNVDNEISYNTLADESEEINYVSVEKTYIATSESSTPHPHSDAANDDYLIATFKKLNIYDFYRYMISFNGTTSYTYWTFKMIYEKGIINRTYWVKNSINAPDELYYLVNGTEGTDYYLTASNDYTYSSNAIVYYQNEVVE